MATRRDEPKRAWVCGIGLATAVGDSTAQTASSVRAGICRYQQGAVLNRQFRPMTLALLPEPALPALATEPAGFTSRQVRMLRLAKLALPQALAGATKVQRVPLVLAGPETLPERPPAITDAFLDALVAEVLAPIDRANSTLLATGRAGGLQALARAVELLGGGKHDHVLFGGVDSWLDLHLLGTLDRDGRVLAEGIMDGFAPGEGAGFVLLCNDRARAALHRDARVRIDPPGLADEPGHRYSAEPYTGAGLAQAVAAALAQADGTPIGTVLASLNGESLGAKEWGTAHARNTASLGTAYRIEHPADCFGDVGAAFGPILVGLAAVGMQRGYLPGPCLVYCASELAARAAVRVVLEPGS
jgi:3-oxoacyl-[acyl-carrier-protein] synthase-1